VEDAAEPKEDEAFVLAAMKSTITGSGMPPSEVATLVFEAVEHSRFWIPTKPSYHDQIRVRHDSMQTLSLPPSPELD
jgi:hypothetical protein